MVTWIYGAVITAKLKLLPATIAFERNTTIRGSDETDRRRWFGIGLGVGDAVGLGGAGVTVAVTSAVGLLVDVGMLVGAAVVVGDGKLVGVLVGALVGISGGVTVGTAVGVSEGVTVGTAVGVVLGRMGVDVGVRVGGLVESWKYSSLSRNSSCPFLDDVRIR